MVKVNMPGMQVQAGPQVEKCPSALVARVRFKTSVYLYTFTCMHVLFRCQLYVQHNIFFVRVHFCLGVASLYEILTES